MFAKFSLKTPEEISVMKEGGSKLSEVRKKLIRAATLGANAFDIDKLAESLIEKSGGVPSFKKVPGYYWSTCVNINEGIVHGIPKKDMVFKKGDLVSIDVGMLYKGFHTDTSDSVAVLPSKKTKDFLEAGKIALISAIKKAKIGNKVYDISDAIEKNITSRGYSPVRSLVGHGVGRSLHEEPQIPCFTFGKREESPDLEEGMTIAIEVMYTQGRPELVYEEDGWTISTHDGKISGLFEETVAVTQRGPIILTA